MDEALGKLQKFLHDRGSMPDLIQCGMIHAQFETIHPFLDGNGRVGRLLITLVLCERKILLYPLLYLSYYLKANRQEYYDRLMAIRNSGDWEGWLKFFLRGVAEVSTGATGTAREILRLREKHRLLISAQRSGSTNGHRLLDYLYERPILNVRMAKTHLKCSDATAGNIVDDFTRIGILKETTGNRRNRIFHYRPYLELFERQIIEAPPVDQKQGKAASRRANMQTNSTKRRSSRRRIGLKSSNRK
jgi:Fic family protein